MSPDLFWQAYDAMPGHRSGRAVTLPYGRNEHCTSGSVDRQDRAAKYSRTKRALIGIMRVIAVKRIMMLGCRRVGG